MKSISLAAIGITTTILSPSSSAFIPKSQNNSSLHKQQSNRSLQEKKALHLYKSTKDAIAEAKMICFEEGPNSERCKVAWDIVEELEAADSHVRSEPSVANELSYSPMVDSLEILSSKIDRKMDELKNLSMSLAEYGAGPEVERLSYASDEMKNYLEDARRAMDQYRQ